jgi:hypothetical protein
VVIVNLMKYAPPSMIGWVEELDCGQPMNFNGPNGLQVKIVITPQGLTVFALAEQADSALDMLRQLGFRPEQIKRMLCG